APAAGPPPPGAATRGAPPGSTGGPSSPVTTLSGEPPTAGAAAPLASRTGMAPESHEAGGRDVPKRNRRPEPGRRGPGLVPAKPGEARRGRPAPPPTGFFPRAG